MVIHGMDSNEYRVNIEGSNHENVKPKNEISRFHRIDKTDIQLIADYLEVPDVLTFCTYLTQYPVFPIFLKYTSTRTKDFLHIQLPAFESYLTQMHRNHGGNVDVDTSIYYHLIHDFT
jgi:hypothetical protein